MKKAIKNILLNSLLGLSTLLLVGCASEQPIGNGIIVNATKVRNPDYHPRNEALTGAGMGAGAGATVGALSGAAAGAAITAGTFGLGVAFIPVLALQGAVTGAVVGGASGGGVGYARGVYKQGLGLYQFTIRLDHPTRTIILVQYINKPLPLYSHVTVIFKNDKMVIKQ